MSNNRKWVEKLEKIYWLNEALKRTAWDPCIPEKNSTKKATIISHFQQYLPGIHPVLGINLRQVSRGFSGEVNKKMKVVA